MSSSDQFSRRRRNPNPFDDDDTVENDAYAPRGGTPGGRSGNARYVAEGNPRSSTSTTNNNASSSLAAPHDPLLDLYERRLQEDVDPDFFNDPENYQALNRVIDIIGAEIGKSGASSSSTDFAHLSQYQSMRHQQRIVEEAIEHMAVRHCADLNSSVAAVGRMSRQFDEARSRVVNLRRQVRDVRDSLRLGELGDVGGAVVRR